MTYNSANADFAHIRAYDPSITVSYPADWKVTEELGGIYLAEDGIGNLEPQVNITRSTTVIHGDPLEACKSQVRGIIGRTPVFDVAKPMTVDGIVSAYIDYHLPSDVETHSSDRDGVFVCVPLPNATDSLWGRPLSSELVRQNFDTILSTYRLHAKGT